MAQRFYNLVLLDAVRADIYSNKKLNYHYYQALKKSVYKPAAFFKGILLPLCKPDGNCTLREAIIIASVLQKVSIPVHHSAVAIHKLALMTEYNGAASIFIKYLLDKKYSLPAPVIKSLVTHFTKFITVEKTKDGDNSRSGRTMKQYSLYKGRIYPNNSTSNTYHFHNLVQRHLAIGHLYHGTSNMYLFVYHHICICLEPRP